MVSVGVLIVVLRTQMINRQESIVLSCFLSGNMATIHQMEQINHHQNRKIRQSQSEISVNIKVCTDLDIEITNVQTEFSIVSDECEKIKKQIEERKKDKIKKKLQKKLDMYEIQIQKSGKKNQYLTEETSRIQVTNKKKREMIGNLCDQIQRRRKIGNDTKVIISK